MGFDFRQLYRRCCRSHVLPNGVDSVRKLLASIPIELPWNIEERIIQRFKNIHGYRVSIGNEVAFFPLSIEQFDGPIGLTRMRDAFLRLGLVLPPYYPMGFLSPMGARAEKLNSTAELEEFANHLFAEMYNESRIATFCTGVYKTNAAVAPYYEHILESAKAYYAKLYRAAILTLIPCVEGIIRNIGHQVGKDISTEITKDAFVDALSAVQKRYIRKVVYADYDWVPSEITEIGVFDRFDEAIQMIQSIKFFLEASLYEHTSRYSNAIGLNRHGIVHGLIGDFHSPANYWRLITLINGLSITSIFAGHAASLFFPGETPDSRVLTRSLETMKRLAGEQ